MPDAATNDNRYCPQCTGPMPPVDEIVWIWHGRFFCSEKCCREAVGAR